VLLISIENRTFYWLYYSLNYPQAIRKVQRVGNKTECFLNFEWVFRGPPHSAHSATNNTHNSRTLWLGVSVLQHASDFEGLKTHAACGLGVNANRPARPAARLLICLYCAASGFVYATFFMTHMPGCYEMSATWRQSF